MRKNLIISFLAAGLLLEKVPWTMKLTVWERCAVLVGWTSTLIIFCFFCDNMAAKWRKYRERVTGTHRIADRLLSRGRKR